MAQLTHNFSFPLPPLVMGPGTNSTDESAKSNGGFEEWGEGSSPSHSESESSRSSQSASDSRASLREEDNRTQNNLHEPLTVSTEPPTISLESRFHSYKQFEEVFEAWKKEQFHPFRVASSETLKTPNGAIDVQFKYRYVVYHCAHYGEPRMRGIGKRPNQTYLPCGCKAMLRLNYNFPERVLKITTLEATHTGHDQSAEVYNKATVKNRSSLSPVGMPPTHKRSKRGHESSFSSSPLSIRNSPANSSSTSIQNSPATAVSPTSVALQNALLFQQQQNSLMSVILNQQKENISHLNPGQMTPQQLQFALNTLQRPQLQQNPNLLNMINQLSLPIFNMQQPAHGVVAPPLSNVAPQQMKTHTEHANELIDVVNDVGRINSNDSDIQFNLPANLPAPKPIKREASPPPVLERIDLETLKPTFLTCLPIKTELVVEEMVSEEQKKMSVILEEMSSLVRSLSSSQIAELLPQLETLLALFKH